MCPLWVRYKYPWGSTSACLCVRVPYTDSSCVTGKVLAHVVLHNETEPPLSSAFYKGGGAVVGSRHRPGELPCAVAPGPAVGAAGAGGEVIRDT